VRDERSAVRHHYLLWEVPCSTPPEHQAREPDPRVKPEDKLERNMRGTARGGFGVSGTQNKRWSGKGQCSRNWASFMFSCHYFVPCENAHQIFLPYVIFHSRTHHGSMNSRRKSSRHKRKEGTRNDTFLQNRPGCLDRRDHRNIFARPRIRQPDFSGRCRTVGNGSEPGRV